MVNVTESSIARESDFVLPIYAGVEIGVASTKAFTCQLGVLAMLTMKAARDTGRFSPTQLATALGQPPGTEQSLLNLAKMFRYWQYDQVIRFAYIIVPAGIVPIIGLLVTVISKRFRKISHRIQDMMGNVSHVTEEAVVGQQVVKVFQGQEAEKKRFEKVNDKTRRLHMRMIATHLASSSSAAMASSITSRALWRMTPARPI